VVVVTEAVMMRPSLLFLVVLLAAGKPCVCVCVCGRGPTLFRALFPFVSHWTDANSRDSLGFFRQWFVCMCYLRGCVFVVDLLDVSVEMRGVSEQGLHLVIRRSFVSDWGFSFEAFSSVFFEVEAFVVRFVWCFLGERMSYFCGFTFL
jgi:hypothetical protein